MTPTLSHRAAAKALQDENSATRSRSAVLHADRMLATRERLRAAIRLWSFVDLGYLPTTSYMLARRLEAKEGAKFKAGRMGRYTITKDPTRAKACAS